MPASSPTDASEASRQQRAREASSVTLLAGAQAAALAAAGALGGHAAATRASAAYRRFSVGPKTWFWSAAVVVAFAVAAERAQLAFIAEQRDAVERRRLAEVRRLGLGGGGGGGGAAPGAEATVETVTARRRVE